MSARVRVRGSLLLLATLILVPRFAGAGGAIGPPPENEARLALPEISDPVETEPVERADEVEVEKLALFDPEEIRFRNGLTVRPEPGLDPATPLGKGSLVLLQFPGPVRAEWLEAVRAHGLVIQEHLQSFAVLAALPGGAASSLAPLIADGTLRAVAPYPLEAKIARGLAWSGGRLPVEVHLVSGQGAARAGVQSLLRVETERGGEHPRVRGWIDAENLAALAALPAVVWIERHEPGRLHNLEAAMAGAADRVAGLGSYDGTGVRVAVVDTGVTRTGDVTQCGAGGATYHPDLWVARIADEWDFHNSDSNACDDNGHGTHTAGTLGGDGTSDVAWTGIAPNVTFLVYKDCCSGGLGFGHFDDVLARAASHDASVVANSWGGSNGAYNGDSYDADRAVQGAYAGSGGGGRPMFVSVSSGNDRDAVAAPATAKNVVTVGAMKDGNWPDDGGGCWFTHSCNFACGNCLSQITCGDGFYPPSSLVCFSNTGPLDSDADGQVRIKPDLVAPGTRIRSLAASHLFGGALYREEDGTSMAQPSVAGTAALVIDAYPAIALWPEMIKARLLATAVSLGDTAQFGHGMLDSFHAVYDSATQSTRRWEGSSIVSTGQETEYTFTVLPGFQEVRVYLTWSDAPSLTTEVVNDLDLRVYDGTNALVGSSASYDDTVEFARIRAGASGTWRAVVRGFNVPQPPARFGLVALEIGSPPALSLDVTPGAACAGRNQFLQVSTSLTDSGSPAVASQVLLDLPDDPSVLGLREAILWTADGGRAHVYGENQLFHDTTYNYYAMTVGQTSTGLPRDVTWNLDVGPAAAEGSYNLYVYGASYSDFPPSSSVALQIDATPPSDATGLAALDRLPGRCSADLTVDMAWNPAGDPGGCGVAGYGLTWTTGGPAPPPELPVIGPASSYSETLPESGSPYYFNLRTHDAAGNWATGYQWWGPFWLDATMPSVVSYLASESHPPGACTDLSTVTMNWGPASDDNCGLSGYSVEWSAGLPVMPDPVEDLDATATQYVQSLPPSNDPRYFTIRSVDNAGNWSDSAIAHGPIYVDTIPAELVGLTLTPSGNDLVFDWFPDLDADFYALYQDTSPTFPAATRIYLDPATLHVEFGAMLDTTPIVYYRVVGTNICGAEGP